MNRTPALAVLLLTAALAVADDPVPIRRELALPGAAVRNRGALTPLSRDEFEKRVQLAGATGRDAPQLATARYTARLEGTNLIGQARWSVRHNADRPGLFRLSPWGLAWRSAAWGDSQEVVVGRLDATAEPNAMDLLVAKPGTHELTVDWSLRGDERSGGTRFELRTPPCAVAAWEFDLPADMQAAWPADPAALRGPITTEGSRARWTIHQTALGPVELWIRSNALPDAPVVLRQANRVTLQADEVEASLDLHFDFIRERRSTVAVEVDPELTIVSAIGPALAKWQCEANDAGGPKTLRLSFAGGQAQADVRVVGRTRIVSGQPWACPVARVVGGIGAGETLNLNVATGVELDDWRPGTLKLVSQQREPDGSKRMLLTTPPFPVNDARPVARPRFFEQLNDVTEQLTWRIEPNAQSLTADVAWTPRLGPIHQATLTLPAGWEIQRVEGHGDEPTPTWRVNGAAERLTLHLDWRSAQTAPRRAVVQLRRTGDARGRWPLPDLIPADVRSRRVTLDAVVSPVLDVVAEGELATASPELAMRFVGGTAPLDGALQIRARRAKLAVRGEGLVQSSESTVRAEHRLQVTPAGGATAAIVLHCTASDPRSEWQAANPVKLDSVKRLPTPVMAADAFSALTTVAMAQGSWWLATLKQPTAQPFELTVVTATERPGPAACDVPLWTVPTASRQEHMVSLAGAGLTAWHATAGDGEINRQRLPMIARYADWPGRLALAATTNGAAGGDRLIVAWGADGRLVCCRESQVESATVFVLPMPAGAEWLTATVDGRAAFMSRDDGRVRVQVPAGDSATLRAFFALPAPACGPIARIALPCVGSTDGHAWPAQVDWRLPAGNAALAAGSSDLSGIDWPVPVQPTESLVPDAGATLWVVRPPVVTWWSVGIGIVAVALLLIRGQGLAGRGGVALAALTALAWVWLPATLQPLAVGPAVVFLAVPLARSARRLVKPRRAAALAAILLLVWAVSAADPEPVVVYVVPATADRAESVLAPSTLLEQLDTLAKRGQVNVPVAVHSADYAGEVVGDRAQFTARWRVQVFRDGATWEFPADGLQLVEVKVDGKPAFPTVANRQCRVKLPKTGRHEVEARFQVAAAGESLRFAVPPSPAARCSLTLPEGAALTHALSGVGALTVDGRTIAADIGAIGEIHVGWRLGLSDSKPPALRQGWLWDLSTPGPRLFGVLQLTPSPGGAASATWTLPGGLLATSARDIDGRSLVGWSQDGDKLTVRLSPSAAGPVTLVAELVPAEPLASTAPLPVPSFAARAPTFIAWRGDDPTLTASVMNNLESIPAEAFQREFLAPAGLGDVAITKAYRAINARPVLRMAATGVVWHGRQQFAWQLAAQHAQLTATAELDASPAGSFVEWELPTTLNVDGVAGDGVAHWSRTGNRLQVWLDGPHDRVALTWQAALPRSSETARFDVPVVRLLHADVKTSLSMTPRPGWELTPVTVMRAAAEPGGRAYVAERPNYRIVLQPETWAKQAEFRLHTVIEPTMSRTELTVQSKSGPVRGFALRVRSDADVQLNAGSATLRESPAEPGWRRWLVEPSAKVGERYQLSVIGRAPPGNVPWSPPLVAVDVASLKPTAMEHRISVSASGVTADRGVRWEGPGHGVITGDMARLWVQPVAAKSEKLPEQPQTAAPIGPIPQVTQVVEQWGSRTAASLLIVGIAGLLSGVIRKQPKNASDSS